MFYVIDGNNVLGALEMRQTQDSAEALTQLLLDYVKVRQVEIILVFDKRTGGWPVSVYEDRGGLQVYGVDPKYDKNADDRIIRYFDDHPSRAKAATVVTADNGLKESLTKKEVVHFMEPLRLMEIVGNPAKYQKKEPKVAAVEDEKENLLSPKQRAEINDEMRRVFGLTEH